MKNSYLLISFMLVFTASLIFFQSATPDTKIKNKIDSKLYPSEWAWIQRTFPYFTYDRNAPLKAINRIKEMNTHSLSKHTSTRELEFAGPVNIGGRVVDIEFNPADPTIVYAASATGGVYKSTDTGETWFPAFDDVPTQTIGDIGIDPVNPNTVYVGTGEANGGHNNFPGIGIFKSTDAGATWEHKGLELTASIGRVVVHPNNPEIIYVAAVGSYFLPNPERGIYKSTDGGETWFQSLFVSDSTGAIDIVLDPDNPDRLMASMWERVRRPNSSHLYGPTSGIYRSFNGGDTWQKIEASAGLPNSSTQTIGRIGLTLHRDNPDIIYALYNDGTSYVGLYRSDNFGESWIDADPDDEVESGFSTFSWYFGQVRVHPENPNEVYVLDVSFNKSYDGGASWAIEYGYSGPNQLHVDHHALAFHPNDPNYLLSGNDGGINISTDGGVSWSNPAQLPATQFYEIGLDYMNPNRLYGGTQDNNSIRTRTGALDDWEAIFGGDGFYSIVDPTNPGIIYTEAQRGYLVRSTNGGASFVQILNGINQSEPTNWSTPIAIDKNNPTVLYYGTDRLYRTTNRGDNWLAISDDLTDGIDGTRLGTLTTIDVAESNSDVIYVGTDDGNVWVTKDYGTAWTDISDGLPYRWVTRVKVDPNNEANVFVTFSGLKWKNPQPHVFKSTDYGETWTDISNNLPDSPVNAFAVDRNNPDWYYLGSDVGAFVTFDGGETWEVLGDNLPVVSVYDMQIHPVENYLAVGTHGRGIYKIDLDDLNVSSVAEQNIQPVNFNLFQNYPNPFNPTTKIKYTVPGVGTRRDLSLQQYITLKVFDSLGREIQNLASKSQQPGTYEVQFDGSNLSSGVYYYKLTAGNYSQTKKMLLLK